MLFLLGRGGGTLTVVRALSLIRYPLADRICLSNAFLPEHDGLGLAALRTRAPDHQLVVLRHMGLPSYVESAVLLFVRSGVRISLLSER